MSGEVTFVPTPVVQLAFACIDELAKAGLVEAGTNADHLIAITHALQAAEKRGAIVFTDEATPRYETSRPSTSMERALGNALRELAAAVNDSATIENFRVQRPQLSTVKRIEVALAVADRLAPAVQS